jgi:protein SCO1
LRRPVILAFLSLVCAAAARQYPASGLVVAVDRTAHSVIISHGEVAGYMDAMVMPFHVPEGKMPESLHAGDMVEFTLFVDNRNSWIENIRVVEFNSAERDPVLASRLQLFNSDNHALAVGASVPDFTLTDQGHRPVTLSEFHGKVVAIDFIYTRCPLPDYCFRLSNNFSRLQKRFRGNQDLILLTVTFDPVRDDPEALQRYAQIWKADLSNWHFLTGPVEEVHRVCDRFGVSYWLDEGLFTHSLHTVVIDRQGRLATNLVGNRFSAGQLGDLVDAVLGTR